MNDHSYNLQSALHNCIELASLSMRQEAANGDRDAEATYDRIANDLAKLSNDVMRLRSEQERKAALPKVVRELIEEATK